MTELNSAVRRACRSILESSLGDAERESEKDRALVRIVDDDAAIRKSMSTMLRIEGYRVETYASAEAFLADLREAEPGCAVLDVRMPGMSGLELQARLVSERVAFPVLFLTGFADVEVAVSSLKAGAVDFLMKPVDEERLFAALNSAIHRDVLRRIGVGGPERIEEGVKNLSEREFAVLSFIAQGMTDAQMAERSGASVRTIEGHRAKIYHKFNVHSGDALALLMPDIRKAVEALLRENE